LSGLRQALGSCIINKIKISEAALLPQAMLLTERSEIAKQIHACIQLGEAFARHGFNKKNN